MDFKCQESVFYRDSAAIIIGKRYGHVTDPTVGRMYDIKIGSRIVRDVPEKELSSTEKEQATGYVSTNYGSAMPYYSK